MRILPLSTFWARWRNARRDRAVEAAWRAQAREHQAARRRVLEAARLEKGRSGRTGPTTMLNAGPLLTFGQERGCRRSNRRR
jgi:hypothetical protein